jgi:hypothetical protein
LERAIFNLDQQLRMILHLSLDFRKKKKICLFLPFFFNIYIYIYIYIFLFFWDESMLYKPNSTENITPANTGYNIQPREQTLYTATYQPKQITA